MFRVFASHLHSERFWFNFRRTYSKHPILPPSILFSGKHVDAFTPTVTSPLSNAERLKLLADPRVFIVKPGQNLPPLVTARGIYPDIGHHQAASTHLKPYEMVLKRIFEKEDPIVIKPTYEVKTESLFEWKSPKKLKFLLAQIQGLPLDEAITQMQFSAKGQSDRVLKVLTDLRKFVKLDEKDPKEMVVGWTCVSKGKTRKQLDIKAKGRCGLIVTRESKVVILAREKNYEALFKKQFKFKFRPENPAFVKPIWY